MLLKTRFATSGQVSGISRFNVTSSDDGVKSSLDEASLGVLISEQSHEMN